MQIMGYFAQLHFNFKAITVVAVTNSIIIIIVVVVTLFTTAIIITIFNLRSKPTIVNVLLTLIWLIQLVNN